MQALFRYLSAALLAISLATLQLGAGLPGAAAEGAGERRLGASGGSRPILLAGQSQKIVEQAGGEQGDRLLPDLLSAAVVSAPQAPGGAPVPARVAEEPSPRGAPAVYQPRAPPAFLHA